MTQPKIHTRLITTGTVVVLAVIAMGLFYLRRQSHPWTRDGQVTANIVMITPQITGEVVRVGVVDNQFVNKGELLFEIDPRRFEHQLEQARVGLDNARQQVMALEASVGVAEAQVDLARAGVATSRGNIEASAAQIDAARSLVSSADAGVRGAQASIDRCKADLDQAIRDRDRAAKLAKDGAGSVSNAESRAAAAQSAKASLEGARASLLGAEASQDNAKAGLAQARADLIVSENGLGQAEAQLASALADLRKAQANLGVPGEENVQIRGAKANLADAELDLAWTRVMAPADGYVTNLVVMEGEYAKEGEALLAFVDRGSFYVQAFFRETQLRHIELGAPAVVTPMGYRGKRIKGTVEGIGWAINPPNIAQTGTAGDATLVPQVQPSFDWIRLAQRVPVRVKIEDVPDGVRLISGTTVSVLVEPKE